MAHHTTKTAPKTSLGAALRAVLLDVDGTLLDSNDAHAQSWVAALDRFGFDVPFERVRDLIGKGGDKLLPEVTGLAKDSPRGKEIAHLRTELFLQKFAPSLRPFAKARALLERFQEAGLTLAVATSANDREVNVLLERAGIADLVQVTTTSSDAKHSKPDPDIVEAALARAGVAAEEAIMLGDTPYDVLAARRAGVSIVALRCGGWADEDLVGAIAVYDDPADLLHHFGESVFASARRPVHADARA